jgi:hypothetical protein
MKLKGGLVSAKVPGLEEKDMEVLLSADSSFTNLFRNHLWEIAGNR